MCRVPPLNPKTLAQAQAPRQTGFPRRLTYLDVALGGPLRIEEVSRLWRELGKALGHPAGAQPACDSASS